MSHLRLTRFRARTVWLHRAPRAKVLLEVTGRALAGLALAAAVFLLVRYPRWWTLFMDRVAFVAWSDPKVPLLTNVQDRWGKYPAPPDFSTGDEPAVRRYLEVWPEVAAIQCRDAFRKTWVRRQGRLVPLDSTRDARLLAWFAVAAGLDPGDTLCPADTLETDHARSPRLVFAGEKWLVLKRWDIGSPEVEGILREALPKPSPIRLGFLPEGVHPRREAPPQPWGAWPSLQIDSRRIAESQWSEVSTNMFGEVWNVFIVPSPTVQASFAAAHRRHLLWGVLQSLGMAGLGGLLWAWRRRKARARKLEADRLAALAHSLKTPLAVLKMQCDLLRFSPGGLVELRGGLLELSEEVDQLTTMIENGLRLFKASHFGGTDGFCEPLGPAWFEDVAGDMEASFQNRSRKILLELYGASAWASPATLQVALQTVLENSLQHGGGMTRLAISQEGRRVLIRVQDQGPGLSEKNLRRLAQGPLRSDNPTANGLGLSLLARIAEEEGWGVELSTKEGEGLTVVLQVPAAPSGLQGTAYHAEDPDHRG